MTAPTPAARARAALLAGQDAARSDRPRSANPHRTDGPTAAERVQARMWATGWDEASPMPVLPDDYDDE